jgi:SlyX protein
LTIAQQDSLEGVQIKIAYLEQAMSELSDVVFRQHKEIQALEAQLKALKERLGATPPDEARTLEQERPPHY